jgi:hypothetical protein
VARSYPEGIDTRLKRFLYNIDRAGASLFGAAPQETISSQAGRAEGRGRLWGRYMCVALNWLNPGHCAHAVAHADRLGRADDQFLG